MAQRRPHHSARSTLALILGLAALLVAIVALVIASLGGSAKGPRDVHLQRYRVGLLPTRPDEPSARDLMGASATVESESEGTAHRPERGATPVPWYGLCPYKSVASLDDFRRVVGSDQRLAAYYGGFHWDKARLVTTTAPRLVYVSYQKAGALARTKYPLLLPKGDTLLTDGVLQARTYCCNEVFEIVDAPPPPPSEGEQPASPLPPSPQALWPPESPLSLAPPAGETPPSELVAPPGAPPISPPSTPGDVPPSSLLSPPGVPPLLAALAGRDTAVVTPAPAWGARIPGSSRLCPSAGAGVTIADSPGTTPSTNSCARTSDRYLAEPGARGSCVVSLEGMAARQTRRARLACLCGERYGTCSTVAASGAGLWPSTTGTAGGTMLALEVAWQGNTRPCGSGRSPNHTAANCPYIPTPMTGQRFCCQPPVSSSTA